MVLASLQIKKFNFKKILKKINSNSTNQSLSFYFNFELFIFISKKSEDNE
jgi:hypothetical protein